MIKVLIADDHPIVLEGIKQILSECDDIIIEGVATSGHEVLQMVANIHYHVVVLDISMPGRDGVDTLKELKKDNPALAVLILSTYPEEQYGLRVLKAGASGYLSKHSAPDKLIEAVRKVAGGGKYISPTLAERLAVAMETASDGPPHEKLSDREYQVLCLIASGKPAKTIADELSLSVKTISTFRSRILKKMNLKNNSEITYYAIKRGLLE
jgi:two-component system invasion response regulator UvrY